MVGRPADGYFSLDSALHRYGVFVVAGKELQIGAGQDNSVVEIAHVELGAIVESFGYRNHDLISKKNRRRDLTSLDRLQSAFVIPSSQGHAGAGKARMG